MLHSAALRPPAPPPAEGGGAWYRRLVPYTHDLIASWPKAAYEEDALIRPLLGRTLFLVNTSQAIRRVLVENTGNYCRTRASVRIFRPLVGDSLLLSEGDVGRQRRGIVAPMFSAEALTTFIPSVAAAADDLLEALANTHDTSVDLRADMQSLTLKVAGRWLLSLDIAPYAKAIRSFTEHYSTRFGRPDGLDFLLPRRIPSPRDLGRLRLRRRWMALVDQIITERQRGQAAPSPRDLFDLLVAARDPEAGEVLTPKPVRDEVAFFLLAGHETTAIALFWACYLAALAPDTQDAIASEADALDLSPERAVEALPKLTHTRAAIQESLRLYPPVSVVAREARRSDDVGIAKVKKGSIVMIAPWVLHRHRRLWRDPDLFDPGRFLPGAPPVDRYAFLPFGAGPRGCMGGQFALAEATLVLAKLLKTFTIEVEEPKPIVPVAIIVTRPDHTPGFRLRRRS